MHTTNRTIVAAVMSLMAFSAAAGPAAIPAGDVVAGKAAFAKCASCHQVGSSARAGFGPQLNGILGRPAGSTTDFRYSGAMQKAGFVWTEDRLRAFLKSPDDVVPGNKMRFWGISNEKELSNLIAYLRTFS